jgi:hypothetical protein
LIDFCLKKGFIILSLLHKMEIGNKTEEIFSGLFDAGA